MAGAQHTSLLQYQSLRDRVIMLDGWSKTYAMTGWRMGYAVWPKALAEHATRLAINCHSCVNAAAQWAGIAALQGPKDDVAKMMTAFDERRAHHRARAEQISRASPASIRAARSMPSPTSARPASRRKKLELALLEEVGVAVIAGTSFGAFGEGYLRFSYANSVDNILAACERIRTWLTQKKVA